MRRRLVWALATALAAADQAADPAKPLTLELRVFNGIDEVTAETRATIHRAGDRGEPLLHASSADGRVEVRLAPGIYDVQAIHEREGRVLNIRWANRLVVMPYPDEPGHHLEVINFRNGFGALQIRATGGGQPDVALVRAGQTRQAGGGAVDQIDLSSLRRARRLVRPAGSRPRPVGLASRRRRPARPHAFVGDSLMPSLSDAELIQRLLLAAFLGGLIGLEREWRNKDAGLRTNILIAIGSAVFTLMSIELTDARTGDTSRVAAQIVTGIGFLGAGAIMRTDAGIQGLTTAATIWVNAAVGVAAGGGESHLAVITTVITLGVLLVLQPIEKIHRLPERRAEENRAGSRGVTRRSTHLT